jgi:23S rRNA (adenine2503-C2)-methyltransferase
MNPAPSSSSTAPPNLYGLDRTELAAWVSRLGAPGFHGDQIHAWLYARDTIDPAAWTDLPVELRHRIAAEARVERGSIVERTTARDRTVKYRIELADRRSVECVYMEQSGRITLCVSSQVGCALGCDFCLTGKMGLARHLDPGEIVGQVALIRADRTLVGPRLNVVFMGMGEPLHNYDGVLAAFRLLTDPQGFGLSRRRITISTAGLAPQIERLAGEKRPPRLAVSLNAATDAVRDRIMPINRRYPLERLLAACREFARSTGERLTFEYVLLEGVNDGERELRELASIVRGLPAKVNLIPFNPVPGWLDYRPPSRERVIEIRDRLLARQVPVSVRFSRGAEARAACGQLALLEEPRGGER